MTLRATLSKWFAKKASKNDRLASVIRSMIPDSAWGYWGFRRDPGIMAEDAFEKVGWVYSCARAIGRNVQQVPFFATKRVMGKAKGRLEQLPDTHPLSQLLAHPNEEEDFSGIMEATGIHLSLRGEAFWELDLGGPGEQGVPRAARIYERPSQWIWKVNIKNDRYDSFDMRMPQYGELINIPGNAALFFKYTNPRDPWRGMSPMKAAFQAADTYYAAQLFNARWFDNAGVPSLVVGFDKDSGYSELRPDVRQRIREEIKIFQAGLQNARGVMIMGPGEKIQALGTDMKDMDFEKLLRFEKSEILAVFGVPPILVGDVDNANRANSSEQRRVFWEEVMIPMVEDVASLMNRKLVPRYGQGLIVQPDYSQVPALRKDLKALSDGVIPWLDAWAMTINEARDQFLDLPPVPWGDEPFSLQYGNVDGAEPPPPVNPAIPGKPTNPDEPDATDENGKILPATGRALVSEWKNATLSRIREGANTPLLAFPPAREAKKATKKFGVPPVAAWELARALQKELAVVWDPRAPESTVANLFDETLERLPSGA